MKLPIEKLWAVLVYLLLIQVTLRKANINHTKSLLPHLFGFHFLGSWEELKRSCFIDRVHEIEITISGLFSVIKGSVYASLAARMFTPDTHI
jgi:hypothetical protein